MTKWLLFLILLVTPVLPGYAQCIDCGGGGGALQEKLLAPTLGVVWIVPKNETEFLNSKITRTKMDLGGYSKANLIANMLESAPSGSEMRIQYSLNESTWRNLLVPPLSLDKEGIIETGWSDIEAGARRQGVYLRLVAGNGDGADSAEFGSITLSIK